MEFFLSNSLSIVLYLSISILENRLSSDAPGYTHIDDDAAPWYFQLNFYVRGPKKILTPRDSCKLLLVV